MEHEITNFRHSDGITVITFEDGFNKEVHDDDMEIFNSLISERRDMYSVGCVEIEWCWEVEYWNNGDNVDYHLCNNISEKEDAELEYNNKCREYDNVILKERRTKYVNQKVNRK
jgi:hypothetical protein